ncbi:MAG: tyrosine-type recombinase/integrase [Cellulosilyticaceae bacterium]
MLLKNLLEEYLLEIRIKNYSLRTIKTNKSLIGLFLTFLNNEYDVTKLEQLSHVHLKAYIKLKQEQGRKPSYINNIIKALISFYNYLVDEGYASENLARKVKRQKVDKTVIKTFTDKEVKNMIEVFSFKNYMNARDRCIITMLADTGIRNHELCQMKFEDIKEDYILIFGKGKKERYVPISPYLKKTMLKYSQVRDTYFKDYPYLPHYFQSFRGNPLTIEAIERVVRLAGKKAGVSTDIRCSPHTLRHYYAQAQLRNGLDLYSVSRLLGHEDIGITKRYLQSLEDKDVLKMAVKTSPLMNM